MPIQANSPPRTAPILPLKLNDPDIPPAVKARHPGRARREGPDTAGSTDVAVTPNRSHAATVGAQLRRLHRLRHTSPTRRFRTDWCNSTNRLPTDSRSGWSSGPKEKWASTRSKMALFISNAVQQPPLHDALLHPALRVGAQGCSTSRKRVFYIDHLVYALHIHSFAYLAIMLIVLITIGLNRSIPGASPAGSSRRSGSPSPTQIFLSIRRVYRQGWFFTVFKFFSAALLTSIVLSTCACHHVLHYNCVAVISRSASASALSILPTSVPDPCALSGRPPPLPPTIGAIS